MLARFRARARARRPPRPDQRRAWRAGARPGGVGLQLGTLLVVAVQVTPRVAAQTLPPLCETRPSPDLRIGSVTGPDAFSDVRDLTVDEDGTIYVLQSQARIVSRFDSTGRRLADIGGQGRGPGEFMSPRSLGWTPDHLWVVDYATRSALLLDSEGREMGRLPPLPMTPPFLASAPLSPLAGERVLYRAWAADEAIAGGEVEALPLVLTTREASPIDTVFRLQTANRVLAVKDPDAPRGGLFAQQPFGDYPIVRVHPRGEFVVVLERPAATREGSATFRLTVFDAAGEVMRRRRFEYVPVLLTEELVNAYVEERVAWLLALNVPMFSSEPRTERWLRDALYTPAYLPPAGDLLVSLDGGMWIRREPRGDDWQRWDIADSFAEPGRTICFPANFELMFVGRGHAFGVERDAFDVPFVVRYVLKDAR